MFRSTSCPNILLNTRGLKLRKGHFARGERKCCAQNPLFPPNWSRYHRTYLILTCDTESRVQAPTWRVGATSASPLGVKHQKGLATLTCHISETSRSQNIRGHLSGMPGGWPRHCWRTKEGCLSMHPRDFAECGGPVWQQPLGACLPWRSYVGSATRFPNPKGFTRFDPACGMLSPMSVTACGLLPVRLQLQGKCLEPVLSHRRDLAMFAGSCCGSDSCLVSTCVWFGKHASSCSSRDSTGTCSCAGCDPLGGAQLFEASGSGALPRVYIGKEPLQSTHNGPVYFPVGSTPHRNSSRREQASIKGHKDRESVWGIWEICCLGSVHPRTPLSYSYLIILLIIPFLTVCNTYKDNIPVQAIA